MCVIIHKPAGQEFDEKDIKLAYENNPHGFGYMYYDDEANKIVANKKVDIEPKEIIKIFENLKDREVVYHFRWKTEGKIVNAQCHPFRVLDRRKHGVDMYMMHNGTIRNTGNAKDESDTQAYVKNFLRPILSKAPSLIKVPQYQSIIKDQIGHISKLCFMYGNGKIVKINEEKGATRHNCWVSNEYSFDEGHRIPKNHNAAGNRNTYNAYNNRGTHGNSTINSSNVCSVNRNNSRVNKAKDNNTSSQETKENKKVVKLYNAFELSVGDKVWVWDYNDQKFETDGEVTMVNHNTIQIYFKNRWGVMVNALFWLEDGKSTRDNEKYLITPSEDLDIDDNDKTVAEKKQEMLNVVMQTVHNTSKEKKEDSKIIDLPQKKEQVDTAKRDDSSGKEVFAPAIFADVSHDKREADSMDRWGGAFVDSAEQVYNGHTFLEFYDMSAQERFDFFNKEYKIAFNMLQDLVEYVILQDEEYYDTLEDDGIDYYEDHDLFLEDYHKDKRSIN